MKLHKTFNLEKAKSGLALLVSPDGSDGSLSINQDGYISVAALGGKKSLQYELFDKKHGAYVFLIEGSLEIEGETLHERDALGVTDVSSIEIKAIVPAKALLIEIPMN